MTQKYTQDQIEVLEEMADISLMRWMMDMEEEGENDQ